MGTTSTCLSQLGRSRETPSNAPLSLSTQSTFWCDELRLPHLHQKYDPNRRGKSQILTPEGMGRMCGSIPGLRPSYRVQAQLNSSCIFQMITGQEPVPQRLEHCATHLRTLAGSGRLYWTICRTPTFELTFSLVWSPYGWALVAGVPKSRVRLADFPDHIVSHSLILSRISPVSERAHRFDPSVSMLLSSPWLMACRTPCF